MADGNRYDAIVVGAGPAGTAAAWLLARSGWNIALVDPHVNTESVEPLLERCLMAPTLLQKRKFLGTGVRLDRFADIPPESPSFACPTHLDEEHWLISENYLKALPKEFSPQTLLPDMQADIERAGGTCLSGNISKLLLSGGQLSGAQVQKDGESIALQTRLLLMAAGSIGSSQLLFQSRVVDASGEIGHNLGARVRLPVWCKTNSESNSSEPLAQPDQVTQLNMMPLAGKEWLELLPELLSFSPTSMDLGLTKFADIAMTRGDRTFSRITIAPRLADWKKVILAFAQSQFDNGVSEIVFPRVAPNRITTIAQLEQFLNKKWLRHMNMLLVDLYGGTIAGKDPYASVADKFGKSWDTPGLYLTGHSLLNEVPDEHRGWHELRVGIYSASHLESQRENL